MSLEDLKNSTRILVDAEDNGDESKKQECVELIKMIYRHHAAGGGLHIVLDDGNTDDDHLEFCVKHIANLAQTDDPHNTWFHCIEIACALLLSEMKEKERDSVIAQAWKEIPNDD